MGFFSKGLKNEFEIGMVSESQCSVLKIGRSRDPVSLASV